MGSGTSLAKVLVLALLVTGYVTLGRLVNLFVLISSAVKDIHTSTYLLDLI